MSELAATLRKFPRADAADSSGWLIDPAYLRKVQRAVSARQNYDLDMEHIEEVLLALEWTEDAAALKAESAPGGAR